MFQIYRFISNPNFDRSTETLILIFTMKHLIFVECPYFCSKHQVLAFFLFAFMQQLINTLQQQLKLASEPKKPCLGWKECREDFEINSEIKFESALWKMVECSISLSTISCSKTILIFLTFCICFSFITNYFPRYMYFSIRIHFYPKHRYAVI